ncbi:Ctr copper transporter family-domain-containing protein [Tricharina praecox]|uniref:Ctr copper transporter family-domain-containing protein n=1 Tax=Tricharina praecox TaxID=43433 RepID=UPI0022204EFA|nr:Ctr copper transporter family-domain-containing protein [Tricharina praecox]KAI5857141.1 Ctr copper transporter family-domain-containing protein [Tricharina praecox]
MSCCHHSPSPIAAMDHSSSSSTHSCGMAMTFQVSYAKMPILFDSVVPRNTGEFIGALVVIFLFSGLLRSLMLLRVWLEQHYWSPSATYNKEAAGQDGRQTFNLPRELARAGLTAVTATLGYAVMLVTMTFVVGYFFAVIAGLAAAEFAFAHLVGGEGGAAGCCG